MESLDVRVAAGHAGREHAARERKLFSILGAKDRQFYGHVRGFVVAVFARQPSANFFTRFADGVEPIL